MNLYAVFSHVEKAYTANQNGVHQVFPAKMAKAEGSSRFASVGWSLDEFVQHQENKDTLSKTHRDDPLLKIFLVSRHELREIENIDAKDP